MNLNSLTKTEISVKEESREPTPKDLLNKFYVSLHEQEIVNSKGKTIKVRGDISNDSSELYLYFEDYSRGNGFTLCYSQEKPRTIHIDTANLNDPELENKNIFDEVLKLIGQNFPLGFQLEFSIAHVGTRRKILNLKEKFDAGEISLEELKEKIVKRRMLQAVINAGFNVLKVEFREEKEGPDGGTIIIIVVQAEKNSSDKNLVISIN